MKTNQEIQAEARQLMVLGSQFQNEQRIASVGETAVAVPLVLANLPVNPALPSHERHVEAAVIGGALVFRLMEREPGFLGSDRSEREDESTLVASSPSAYDEERLAAALERYVERNEDVANPADGETVAELERILETKLLPHADRLRTKAEVVEFLEGRLESSALIARNIERQCSREVYREHLVERHELKLTIGEP
jgi:hypothetical protein